MDGKTISTLERVLAVGAGEVSARWRWYVLGALSWGQRDDGGRGMIRGGGRVVVVAAYVAQRAQRIKLEEGDESLYWRFASARPSSPSLSE